MKKETLEKRVEQLEQSLAMALVVINELNDSFGEQMGFNKITVDAINTLSKAFTRSADLMENLPEDVAKEINKQDGSGWWKNQDTHY